MLDDLQLTGEVKISEDFRIKETDSFDPVELISILDGDLLGVIVREYVHADDVCDLHDNPPT